MPNFILIGIELLIIGVNDRFAFNFDTSYGINKTYSFVVATKLDIL